MKKEKLIEKKFNLFAVLAYCFKLLFKHKPLIGVFKILMHVFYAVSTAVEIFLYALLFEELATIFTGTPDVQKIFLYAGIYVGLRLLIRLVDFLHKVISERLDIHFQTLLRRQMIEKINTVKYINMKTADFKQASQLAHEGMQTMIPLVGFAFSFVEAIFAAVSTAIVLSAFHFSLPLILIAVSIPVVLITFKLQKAIYSLEWWNVKEYRAHWEYSAMFTEKNRLAEVRNYNSGELFFEKWKVVNNRINKRNLKVASKYSTYNFVTDLIKTVFHIGVIIWALWLAINGWMLAGQFVAAVLAIAKFKGNLGTMVEEIGWMYGRGQKFDDYINFFKFEDETKGAVQLSGFNSEISIKDAVFKYPKIKDKESSPEILKSLNFKIKKGERVAVVGANGSGKTTLIGVILGLLELESGSFTVDGIPYKDLDISSYKQNLSIVYQDFARYHAFTVRENVGIGNIQKLADDDAENKALEKGQVTDAAKEGLDRMVGKEFEGLEFSGGQWQKLAISRSFFKDDAKIYIMDEPTSALDPIVENTVLENFMKETENKTAIIISHRLSLCKKVDRVVYMEDGKIVEDGSHSQLIKQKGKYAEMFKNQQKWYE